MRSLDRYNVSFSRVPSDSNEKNTFNAKVFWIDELVLEVVIEVYTLQPACRLINDGKTLPDSLLRNLMANKLVTPLRLRGEFG